MPSELAVTTISAESEALIDHLDRLGAVVDRAPNLIAALVAGDPAILVDMKISGAFGPDGISVDLRPSDILRELVAAVEALAGEAA